MTRLAWFLSFWTGFTSLSEEILWVRIVSFASDGTPQAFALVLTAFLGGIALGALSGKRLSEKGKATPGTAAWLLLIAGFQLMLLPAFIAAAHETPAATFWFLLLILFGSAVKGMLFPIVHHLGSPHGDTVGRSVSRTYFCNILGATTGPLFTGLFLLDRFSSGTNLQILGILCLIGAMLPLAHLVRTAKIRAALSPFFVGVLGLASFPYLQSSGSILIHELATVGEGKIRVLIENRHGIVHSVAGLGGNDIVYGGNVYDGNTNIDLANNSNLIDRAYLLYGLHPEPRRVLVIGLSSGAWTRVVTAMPSVEKIDVVEINPGYIEMIRTYPQLSPLLDDPRVELHIDDGRRWLRRSHEKFDLIVMNTTFHWRANITNLLSVEMMELVRGSLAPKGIFAFNTTSSDDAFYTAAQAFPFSYRFRNFVYAAKHDFRNQVPSIKERLRKMRLNGQALLSDNPATEQSLDSLAAVELIEPRMIVDRSRRPLVTITDQNMITEFRFGRWSGDAAD